MDLHYHHLIQGLENILEFVSTIIEERMSIDKEPKPFESLSRGTHIFPIYPHDRCLRPFYSGFVIASRKRFAIEIK